MVSVFGQFCVLFYSSNFNDLRVIEVNDFVHAVEVKLYVVVDVGLFGGVLWSFGVELI